MNSFTGKPVRRKEDARLLRGLGQFVDDLHVNDMLHAAIFRSAWAHGKVRGIDISRAVELPGVVGVFTHADFASHLKAIRPRIAALPHFEDFLQLPIATDKVRYVGEPIAIVVADSPYIAEDALALIDVDVEELPPILNWDDASEGSVFVHDKAATNTSTVLVGRGDAEVAFATAPYVRRERFSMHRHTAMPMETRGLLAVWDAERECISVSGATKIPFFNRTILASMLDLPLSSVIMNVSDVGGGFGVRGEFYPEDFMVPFLARKLRRAVKWIEDRREHFLATNHSRETVCDLEIACHRDGTIVGLRGTVTVDIGAYARGTGGTPPTRCAQFLPGPYRIPNYHCAVNVYISNKTPSGTYRGPGRVEANFFRERLVDMAAADLGIDPAEMRRINLITVDEMPFNMGQLVSYEPPEHFDSGDFLAVLEEALREIGWEDKKFIQGKKIDGWFHGVGLAPFVESGAGGAKEHARICLEPDGSLRLYVGSASSGQGHETVFAQLCADALQLPLEAISVRCASTDQLLDSWGTYHSRSAVMAGNAVLNTAKAFSRRLHDLAADHFGLPNSAIEWRDGMFFKCDSAGSVSLSELARFAANHGQAIDVTDVFEHKGMKPFSYGTHAAHVAVDSQTGRVKVIDFIAIEDIGRVLNPLIAHGQSLGAIVQGLGGVLMEQLHYDETGQLVTASFADYLLPTATDFPNIRGKFMELAMAPGNPLGAKGGGEGGIVATAAAVGNAVSAALSSFNVQVRDLPLTPPRVWQLIQNGRSEKL